MWSCLLNIPANNSPHQGWRVELLLFAATEKFEGCWLQIMKWEWEGGHKGIWPRVWVLSCWELTVLWVHNEDCGPTVVLLANNPCEQSCMFQGLRVGWLQLAAVEKFEGCWLQVKWDHKWRERKNWVRGIQHSLGVFLDENWGSHEFTPKIVIRLWFCFPTISVAQNARFPFSCRIIQSKLTRLSEPSY